MPLRLNENQMGEDSPEPEKSKASQKAERKEVPLQERIEHRLAEQRQREFSEDASRILQDPDLQKDFLAMSQLGSEGLVFDRYSRGVWPKLKFRIIENGKQPGVEISQEKNCCPVILPLFLATKFWKKFSGEKRKDIIWYNIRCGKEIVDQEGIQKVLDNIDRYMKGEKIKEEWSKK